MLPSLMYWRLLEKQVNIFYFIPHWSIWKSKYAKHGQLNFPRGPLECRSSWRFTEWCKSLQEVDSYTKSLWIQHSNSLLITIQLWLLRRVPNYTRFRKPSIILSPLQKSLLSSYLVSDHTWGPGTAENRQKSSWGTCP